MKKTWIVVLALLLAISMVYTAAFAESSDQQEGQPDGGQKQDGGQMGDGEQPDGGDGEPGGEMGDGQQPGGQMGGGMNMNTDEVSEAISGLDDEDTASTLTALLEAYEEAAAGTDMDAQQEALQALQEALTEAGIEIAGMQDDQMGGGMNMDTDAIAEAINDLDDTDTISSLTALLEAYEEAAAGTDIDAQQEAMQTLQEALTEAGIEVAGMQGGDMGGGMQNGDMGDGMQNGDMNSDTNGD